MTTEQRTRKRRAIQRFSVISKMGFPDEVRCWCGKQVQVGPHLREFLREHGACSPPKEEHEHTAD